MHEKKREGEGGEGGGDPILTISAQKWQWSVFQKSVLEGVHQTTVQVPELSEYDLVDSRVHGARRQ